MKKAAVLFPGIGYSVDRPLLYYSGKMAQKQGYEIIKVPYTGFPKKKPGDRDMMREAFRIGRSQAEEILKEARLEEYNDLIFFSKSVGTAVGSSYADDHGLDTRTRHILYTPVEGTYSLFKGKGIAFHGTSDPWAGNEVIRDLSRQKSLPLYLFEGANHSLETGDIIADIGNLRSVMETVRDYLFPAQ